MTNKHIIKLAAALDVAEAGRVASSLLFFSQTSFFIIGETDKGP